MVENKFGIDNFLGEELLFADICYDQYALPEINEKSTIDIICLYFKVGIIKIKAIADTDEICLEFIQGTFDKKKRLEGKNIFTQYIGQQLNQVWNCTNAYGYFDLYILGFSYLDPSILIVSETSELKLFEANQN